MKTKRTLLAFAGIAVIAAAILYQVRFIIIDMLPYRIKSKVDIIVNIPKNRRGVYLPLGSKSVTFYSDNLRICADLYKAHGKALGAIVLLHGSSPYGRKLALYPLLAKKLNEKGYTVLSIDLRGFGDSEDPQKIGAIASWNFTEDVKQAISYLEKSGDVSASGIFIIGHSFGGEIAITAGITDERVKKIVSIGPGRRRQKRMLNENATEKDYYLKRFSNDAKLKSLLPLDVLLTLYKSIMIDSHLDYFAQSSHKPLFLIDGEIEDEKDKIFLKGIYERIEQPKKYVTLANSDHYCNTTSLFGIIFYDKSIMNTLVESIDSWLKA